jgi:hypothetical protein
VSALSSVPWANVRLRNLGTARSVLRSQARRCTYSIAVINQCAYNIAVINQCTYSIAVVNQCTYSIAVVNQCTYSIAVINQCAYSMMRDEYDVPFVGPSKGLSTAPHRIMGLVPISHLLVVFAVPAVMEGGSE